MESILIILGLVLVSILLVTVARALIPMANHAEPPKKI